MPFFRKKPVVIDAMQFDGGNSEEIISWSRPYGGKITYMDGFTVDLLAVHTLEGRMVATVGDWIIRGIKNEFYPCKSDIFSATYEPI